MLGPKFEVPGPSFITQGVSPRRDVDYWDGFDEGSFVDSAYGNASGGQACEITPRPTTEISTAPHDIDDASSEYSDISTAESDIDLYMKSLADDLFCAISSLQTDPEHSHILYEQLPDLLQEFALRIGLETQSKEGCEVMVFVHKYRNRVADFYEQHFMNRDNGQEASTTIPAQEKVANWLTQKSAGGSIGQEDFTSVNSTTIPLQEEESADAKLLQGPIYNVAEEQHIWTLPDTLDNADKYRAFIVKTSAYSWLLAKMGRGITQAFLEDDLMKTVHDKIWKHLQPLPRISTRRSPVAESLTFSVDWDPISFISEQGYVEDPCTAIQSAITLTGSPTDVQGLSCLHYLNQTWPSSGKLVISLIHKLMRAKSSVKVHEQIGDCSMLATWRFPSSILLKVVGSRSSIAEVGEQLAWLGAALRSSPYDGIAYCRPHIDDSQQFMQEQLESKDDLDLFGNKAVRIHFSFERECTENEKHGEGRCWSRLFRNPVLVRGFPILRRNLQESGLELPLSMIAELVGVSRAHVFNDVVFIKGYSTMLVPSRQERDVIVWHVFSNADGSRISYLDNTLPHLQGVGIHTLQRTRHIIGWCSKVTIHAGENSANYNIERSRLSAAGTDCVLEKVSISGGKFITAGFSFSIGIKDIPVHVSRKPYLQKLRWVSSKFIVLWDEREKRGWLVNGVRALLHLVRASLKHYESDAFKEALLSRSEDILEPAVESQEDYAISVLRNEYNMKLPIYAEKDEVVQSTDNSTIQDLHDLQRNKKYYRLEDRVEELYEVLEKLIDHQINVTGQAGVKMRACIRRRLEGWDFKDLASDKDPIYPRIATLHALGKGWVDFVRSIQAVTLFGKGFGQIIEPSSSFPCRYWSDVPKGRFYLAACMPDLRQIMETDGDCTGRPVRLCNGISWYTPTTTFDNCRCNKTSDENHSDFVQILWPTRLQGMLPKQEKEPLLHGGAVIFGHNVTFKWKWEDTGDPVEGEPALDLPMTEDDFHDSGLGLTETSDSRKADQGPPGNAGTKTVALSPQNSGDNDGSAETPRPKTVSPQTITGSDAVGGMQNGENATGSLKRLSKAGKNVRRFFSRGSQ